MAEIQKKISRCIRELEKEYFSENRMRSSCIYALLLQIFVILARGSINQKERGARGSLLWPEKLAVVIEDPEKHCGEDIDGRKAGQTFWIQPGRIKKSFETVYQPGISGVSDQFSFG